MEIKLKQFGIVGRLVVNYANVQSRAKQQFVTLDFGPFLLRAAKRNIKCVLDPVQPTI